MKRINKLKAKVKKSKYPLGGRFGDILGDIGNMNKSDAGDLAKNFGKTVADTALSSIGLSNVIPDSSYEGTGNNGGKIANTIGMASKIALPFALQAAGVPMPVTSAIQSGLGSFNPQSQKFPYGGLINGSYGIGKLTLEEARKLKYNKPIFLYPDGGKKCECGEEEKMEEFKSGGFMGIHKSHKGYCTPMTKSTCTPRRKALAMTLKKHHGFHADGGIQNSNNPNAELEKQEVFQTPNGQTQQVNGPTHENGGVQVNIPNGTRIWSDRLKMNGKTFAKHAAKYKTNKEEKILSDNKASLRDKESAKLNMTSKNNKLDELFQMQESLKVDQQTNDMYKCGGMVQMKNGGIYIKPQNRGKFTAAANRAGMGVQEYASHIMAHKENYSSTLIKRANFAKNAASWKHLYGGIHQYPDGGSFDPNVLPESLDEVTAAYNRAHGLQFDFPDDLTPPPSEINDPTFINPQQSTLIPSQGNININQTPETLQTEDQSMLGKGINVLQKAGNYLNTNKKDIGREAALFGMNNLGNLAYLAQQGKKYDTVDYGQVNPNLMTDEESLRQIKEGYNTGLYNIKNTGNISQSGRIALTNQRMKEGAAAKERIVNMNNSIKNQFAQYNKGLQVQGMQDTAANKGQSQTNYYAALSSLGQNSAMQTRDYMQRAMDQKKFNLIKDIFPDYKFDPETFSYMYKLAQKQQGS